MTRNFREWLPESALTDERIGAALQPCLDDWSGRWFAIGGTDAIKARLLRTMEPVPDGAIEEEGVLARIAMPARGKRALLERVLSETLEGKNPTPRDHELLDRLARRIVCDLLESIEQLFGSMDGAPGYELHIAIRAGKAELFRLTCPAGAIVRLIRTGIPKSCPNGPAFTDRLRAIAPCAVEVEASLGHATVSVDDLGHLEADDVLVLETALTSHAVLQLSGGGRSIGTGRISSSEGRNALIFKSRHGSS